MDPTVLTIIASALVIGFGLGWVLARFLHPRLGVAVAVLVALVMVGLILAGRVTQGWEGLGYVIMALFMAAPVAVGAAAGTALAAWQRRRTNR